MEAPITERTQLGSHPLKGALLEVDVVLDFGREIEQIEIKSGKTLNAEFFAPLKKLAALHGSVRKSYLVYGGGETLRRETVQVMSRKDVGLLVV